jgi:hypothetical protein
VTTGQLEASVTKYGNSMPPELQDAIEDALLEASLMARPRDVDQRTGA